MRLIGEIVLTKACRKHADARPWLQKWAASVKQAAWRNLDDVRLAYPHADGVKVASGAIVTVFNCKGNAYRLLTLISFRLRTVEVAELQTHADYDKGTWKGRY